MNGVNDELEDEERDSLGSIGGHSATASTSAQSGAAAAAVQRRRRAYGSGSGRDLSTSAKKRQSVLALGSIKHLQHHFAKTGLAATNAPQVGSSGRPLPLAVPGYAPDAFDESLEDLPPSPSPPNPLPRHVFPAQDTLPSLRIRREQVYREVSEVCTRWGLIEMGKHLSSRRESSTSAAGRIADYDRSLETPSPSFSEDRHEENLVLTLLQTTTSAIRSVQKYFLSLPPDKLPYSASTERTQRREASNAANRPATLGVITSARPIPRYSNFGQPSRQSLSPPRDGSSARSDDDDDPLLRLRKASLATLGALKEMDAQYRLTGAESVDDVELDAACSAADISGGSVLIERNSSSESGSSSTGTGATGHLYNDEVSLGDLWKEAEAVRHWIETVDSLLFAKTAEAAMKTPRPRADSGKFQTAMSESTAVPRWAREEAFSADGMEQVFACLQAHLPPELLALLPDYPTSDAKGALLYALSDGQLLCTGYNVVLRKSQRPWGFIPAPSIHDLASITKERSVESPSASSRPSVDSDRLQVSSASSDMRRSSSDGGISDDGRQDGKAKVGLTFRRAENLRVFVAALKLRYLVQMGSSIDLKVIARKESGWMDMLEEVAVQWVRAAAEEKREEDPESD